MRGRYYYLFKIGLFIVIFVELIARDGKREYRKKNYQCLLSIAFKKLEFLVLMLEMRMILIAVLIYLFRF